MIGLMRRFGGERRGAAAVEFALIAPFLFVIHLAAVEFLQAFEAQRRIAHLAAAMADVAAQSRSLSQAEVDDILMAGPAIIQPFPTGSLGQRIASLSADSGGSVSVDWSQSRNYSASGAPTVPSGYLQAGESVIVTDVIYEYRPSFRLFMPQRLTFERHAYVRPRLAAKIVRR